MKPRSWNKDCIWFFLQRLELLHENISMLEYLRLAGKDTAIRSVLGDKKSMDG